jgi:hypothetical protein
VLKSVHAEETYLRTEIFYLRSGVTHHLDPILVVGHGTGQVGDLDQLVSVFLENGCKKEKGLT